jgi:hypothetical protein
MKKVKTIFAAILFASFILTSCVENKSNPIEPNENNTTKEINKTAPVISRNPELRLDVANVFWKKEYTLFDLITDEPIYPISKGGKIIYQIYYSSNEDPTPHFGEFTPEQLENHLFYKFKNKENCIKFYDSK